MALSQLEAAAGVSNRHALLRLRVTESDRDENVHQGNRIRVNWGDRVCPLNSRGKGLNQRGMRNFMFSSRETRALALC